MTGKNSKAGHDMKSFKEFVNEAKYQAYGPFKTKEEAIADAKEEIGGGTQGKNFFIEKEKDGFYWSETKKDGSI